MTAEKHDVPIEGPFLHALWAVQDMIERIDRHRFDPKRYPMPTYGEYVPIVAALTAFLPDNTQSRSRP